MIHGGLDDTESSTPGLACTTEQNRYHKVLKNNLETRRKACIFWFGACGLATVFKFVLFWFFGLLSCFANLLKLDVQELFCLIAERNVLACVKSLILKLRFFDCSFLYSFRLLLLSLL